ncbi:MAG: hypothetical protein RSA01_07085 [Clostridium sp.]
MTHENNPLEEKRAVARKKSSNDSRSSKTGYMDSGNEQKFKRRG